jgi:hypothetical protein
MIRPRWRAWLWLGGIFSALVMVSSQARACFGPDTRVVFHWSHHPDFPLDRFAAGRLGVLEPTFARSYLVVAYRYVVDQPLSAEEQQGAVDLWQRRLNGPGAYLDLQEELDGMGRAEWSWQGVREPLKHIPLAAAFSKSQPGEDERFHQIIPEDVLGEAAAILQRRIAQWGERDPRLAAWVQAQDLVFGCSPRSPHIPEALPATAAIAQQRDRHYQIAMAHYLSGDLEQAEPLFQSISKDGASLWRKGAWVMQARIWWRRAERRPAEDAEGRKADLMKAADLLRSHDPEDQHYGLGQQIRFSQRAETARPKDASPDWSFKAHCLEKAALAEADPKGRARALADVLMRRDGTPDFTLDLGDYTILLDRQIQGEGWEGEGSDKARSIPAELLKNDLTEWVFTFREPSGRAFRKAYANWQAKGSRAWLLLALMHAAPESPGLEALMQAGAQVPWTHPSAPTIHYHLARLDAARGKREEAHQRLTAGLALGSDVLSPSAINRYRALRLPLAHTLPEALADAQRLPVGANWVEGELASSVYRRKWEARYPGDEVAIEHPRAQNFFEGYGRTPALLEADGAALLNRELPLRELVEISELKTLPDHLRDEWQRAAWVKAALLGRWEEARHLAELRVAQHDLLEASFRSFLTAKEPHQEALWILLHHPGLRWYAVEELHWRTYASKTPWNVKEMTRAAVLGGNWWRDIPAMRGDEHPSWEAHAAFMDGPPAAGLRHRWTMPLSFLSEADREAARREFKTLESLGSGPLWLCKETMAWAKEHPEDPRLPEALHFAVRSARYADASPYQKQAFQLLHRRYASSPWAAKTPVWH